MVSREMMPVEVCVIRKAPSMSSINQGEIPVPKEKNCSLILKAKDIDELFLKKAFS